MCCKVAPKFLIAIKVALRFISISKLSQNPKTTLPNLAKNCWFFDAVARFFASYNLDFA